MASGQTLWAVTARNALQAITIFPSPAFLTFDTNFKEEILVYDGDSTEERAVFEFVWPNNYAGGGIKIVLGYSTDGTATASLVWEFQLMAVGDTDDYDSKTFAAAVAQIIDTPATTVSANKINLTAELTITHANCDSPVAGEKVYIRVARAAADASDTNTDDGQFHFLRAEEV